jgi:hypothetical protein
MSQAIRLPHKMSRTVLATEKCVGQAYSHNTSKMRYAQPTTVKSIGQTFRLSDKSCQIVC